MFALVDCNNFFVSCERVFNPKLENRPVVVLSNNDGCIISRSNEAKAVGIAMAAPLFKIQETIKRFNVAVLSSNYTLYGDMSRRVMSVLQSFCPEMEIYSIDEAFLNLQSFANYDLITFAQHIRKTVKQWTGIPICVGIAPTKTLAKVANSLAKKQEEGVFSLISQEENNRILKQFPITEIWGVGRKLAPRILSLGIKNAYELSRYPSKMLRKHFNVMLEKLAYELQGVSCLALEEATPRRNIQSTRSFGRAVTDIKDLKEAISSYAAIACDKLRKQKCLVQGVCIYLRTSRFKETNQFYSKHHTAGLLQPTDDSRIIINYAVAVMERLFEPGYAYHKCGIILFDIIPNHIQQKDLLLASQLQASSAVMEVMDAVNRKFGKGKLMIAAEGLNKTWLMKSSLRSPLYTTKWNELPVVV